jgi:PAS domain S-box-containing protein
MKGQKPYWSQAKRHREVEYVDMQLAQTFLNVPFEKLDGAIIHAMQFVAEYCSADRAVIYGYDRNSATALHLYEWDARPEYYTGNNLKTLRLSDIETAHTQYRKGKAYLRSSLEELPAGSAHRRVSENAGIDALCSYPIINDSAITGIAAFSTACRKKEWAENEIALIELFSKIIMNILERKEQETAFRECVYNNQVILDSINEGVGMYDRDGNALFVNRHLAEKFGKTKEECIGVSIRDLLSEDMHGDRYGMWKDKFDEAFSSGRCATLEAARDGRWYSNSFYPILRDGRVTAVTLCSSDITDKKMAISEAHRAAVLETEAAMLRKNEAEYLEILDGSTEATWIKDLVNGTCEFSKQWLKRIGEENIPSGEMNSFIVGLVHPEDRARLVEERDYVCHNKLVKYQTRYRLRIADGSYIWVLDKGKISYDVHGNPIKIFGTSTDITEQKKSEAVNLHQNKILKSINMIYEKALTCETANELGAACLDIIGSITESQFGYIGEIGRDGLLHGIPSGKLDWAQQEKAASEHKITLYGTNLRGLIDAITAGGKSLLTNTPAAPPDSGDLPAGQPEINSFLGVPYLRDNKVAGVLASANRDGGYSEVDKDILEAVAPTIFEVLLRKRIEEKVRENEFLMRTIMDSSSDFMFIKDKESRMVMVNQAYCNTFGVHMDDIVGKRDYTFYRDPNMVRDVMASDKYVMETGEKMNYERPAMTTAGIRTFALSKVPWRDTNGEILGILGVAHDITELKKAEASLQEMISSLKHSKDYINILYETTGQVLSSLSPRQEIYELCAKVMRFLDCHTFFNYLVEEDKPDLHLNACGGITEEQRQELEYLPLGCAVCGCAVRDGCRIIAENIQATEDTRTVFLKGIGMRAYVCHPLIADGRVIGGLAFGTRSRDKFSEEDLMLMKTVAESVAVAIKRKQDEETLLRQAEELIIADRNKNEFLGTLSHELRNPLATITAGLSLLDVSQDAQQQSKAKAIMKRQTEYLCRLVDDLLDITRITRNKITLRKEAFELNTAALMVAEDMRALYEEKSVWLEKNIKSNPLVITADPVRVKQIIGNLLHNALKFTNNGCMVVLSVYSEEHYACISVKDNGIGVEQAFMPSLFEPFTQADDSIDRRNGGLGLGLSIVRGIAELHGGCVKAYSEGPGKGSEFIIYLPVSS